MEESEIVLNNKIIKKPKALIEVNNKPILFHLLDNLELKLAAKVIIPYHRDYEQYNLEQLIKDRYPKINFLFHKLPKNTRGVAETNFSIGF